MKVRTDTVHSDQRTDHCRSSGLSYECHEFGVSTEIGNGVVDPPERRNDIPNPIVRAELWIEFREIEKSVDTKAIVAGDHHDIPGSGKMGSVVVRFASCSVLERSTMNEEEYWSPFRIGCRRPDVECKTIPGDVFSQDTPLWTDSTELLCHEYTGPSGDCFRW